MKKILTALAVTLFFCASVLAQDSTIYLWRNVKGMEKQPSVMFMHKAASTAPHTRTAVIVCPGGSYHHLGLKSEGNTTATWFAENGVTAFVLKYRTAESLYHYPAMLQDIQRAIQLVRENADAWDIDPDKVGVIGFSAGGHLVTMAGEFWQTHDEISKLGIQTNVSLRPDFVIPVYPVVSMQDDMPPTYVVVCDDDPVVIPENSLRLYDALQAAGIESRLARYPWGKHGFGMKDNAFMKEFHYNEALHEWLKELGFME